MNKQSLRKNSPGPRTGVMTRRAALGATAALAASCGTKAGWMGRGGQKEPKPVAAIITEYRRICHADCIVTRMLEGYEYEGIRRTPRVKVVAMYTDQVPKNDISRDMAARHGVRIAPTIREAVLDANGRLAVEGVVIIGEHGTYPSNEKGQHLYPRYEFFSQVVESFQAAKKAVPVFCDKHLSYDWEKAKRMYDWSRNPGFPFMAGSSLPLSWRRPPLELALGTPVEEAVVCFYGGKESYGFHALEGLQCMVERRKGGETGVAAIQCIEGPEVWKWTDAHPRTAALLDEALNRCPDRKAGSPRTTVKTPILFVIEYRDGLKGAVYMLNGHTATTGFAARIRGTAQPVSTEIWLQPVSPFSHFSGLVYNIEEMVVSGKAQYPAERTLLTTGMLAAIMDSSWEKGKRLETPHLGIAYRTPDRSFFSRGPVPKPEG